MLLSNMEITFRSSPKPPIHRRQLESFPVAAASAYQETLVVDSHRQNGAAVDEPVRGHAAPDSPPCLPFENILFVPDHF